MPNSQSAQRTSPITLTPAVAAHDEPTVRAADCTSCDQRTPVASQRHSTNVIPLDTYLSPTDLVAMLRGSVTEATLRNWRSSRHGPAYVTVGRRVWYSPDAVKAWFDSVSSQATDHWQDRA